MHKYPKFIVWSSCGQFSGWTI